MNATTRWIAATAVAAALLGLTACQDYALTRPEVTDVFFQDPPSAVDILLIVDNSCSMMDEQTKLSAGFQEFVTYFEFADVDYHIGVVTTDTADPNQSGRLRGTTKWIEPSTSDAATVFQQNVMVGTTGSGSEKGLDAARKALGPELASGYNAGFLREDAYLSLIFVSDEEDYSSEPVGNYINFFWSLKGERERGSFNASALVGADDSGAPADCGDTADPYSGANAAHRYVDVAAQTGGVVRSICSDDFAPIITEMGLNTSRLTDRFQLTSAPDPHSIEVDLTPEGEDEPIRIESDDADYAWEYRLESEGEEETYWIVFVNQFPPVNSKIVVRYDLGDGAPIDGDDDE